MLMCGCRFGCLVVIGMEDQEENIFKYRKNIVITLFVRIVYENSKTVWL